MYISFSDELSDASEFNNKKGMPNYFFGNSAKPIELKPTNFIGEFKKINFFVGSNNSGKSRFLRGIFKIDKYFIQILENNKNFKNILHEIESAFKLLKSEDHRGIQFSSFRDVLTEIFKKHTLIVNNKEDLYPNLIKNYNGNLPFFEELATLKEKLSKEYKTVNHNSLDTYYVRASDYIEAICKLFEMLKYAYDNGFEKCVYIPILRTIITDENLNKESFNKISEAKYGLKGSVFTGLKLFDEVHKLHNSVDLLKLEEFAFWLEENFYTGKNIKIIPDSESKNLKIKIDDEIHNIFDIGDGIQQLILLLFPVFTSNEKTWFFIEEPETHLHPGLQRIFIETLLDNEYLKSKNLRYFFTTHSNHFLDLSLHTDDISIFQFQKETKEKFNIKSVKPNKETLDLLGVNNSSVLIANSSVWVEGPTDRKYISRFLKLYCEHNEFQHLKEDIDFAFFEYGGNLIEHYLFDEDFEEIFTEKQVRDKINSFALANRIYLLADNDNAEGKKLERREKLVKLSEDERNFKYQNTNYREIENLLPLRIVKDFMVELVKTSDKDKIVKIDFKREDYISIGLGDFIVNLFETNNIKDFKKFKDESGTLKSSYKLKLCNMVVESEYSYDDLVLENNALNELVENLYKFIKNQA